MGCRRLILCVVFAAQAVFSGCNGGGGGASSGGGLILVSTNLISGTVLPINAPIRWTFDKPILLSSANLSTVSLRPLPPASLGAPVAGPVHGSFFHEPGSDACTLVFQPTCSTDPSFGPNSGPTFGTGALVAGNSFGAVSYEVTISGGSSAGGSLTAEDGSTLAKPFTVVIQTPVYPAQWPYLDTNPQGFPAVIEVENLPATLGLNLAIDPNPPLSFVIDQSVFPDSIDDGSIRLEFSHPVTGQLATGQPVVIPAKVILAENCNPQGRAVLQVFPFGVLPPDVTIQFFLSGNVAGYGINDRNGEDLLVHLAQVVGKHSDPQPDAFFEGFETADQMDPNPPLLEAPAVWDKGRLEAAAVFPGNGAADFEIGPGTINGAIVTFSTDGGTLQDTQGNFVFFPDGVIEAHNFSMRSPTPGGKSRFLGIGSRPLVIRCSGDFTVEAGAWLNVDGSNAKEVSGIQIANQPQPGGPGQCSGGDGGKGSPETTKSSARGEDGYGPFQLPSGGGLGGHSAYGSPSNNDVMPGGGGGGNWGILERDSAQNWNWVSFCYANPSCSLPGCPLPPTGCGDPGCNGIGKSPATQGEAGASGNQCLIQSSSAMICNLGGANGAVCQLDALDSLCLAKGGAAGSPVFQDADPRNNFFGRKPFLQGQGVSILQGENSPQVLGGQGGGGSGNAVPGKSFPSGPNFAQSNLRGGAGGGGGGALLIQALGRISIHGELSADGGDGGMGESDSFGSPGGGGGGGGSGGMIVLEAGEQCRFGSAASVHAIGGNRGKGGFTIPLQKPVTSGQCRGNTTAGRGGAGGKGVTIVHAPFVVSSSIVCANETQPSILPGAIVVENANSLGQSIDCEADPLLGSIFDPDPHVLAPTFGTRSAALSKWFYAGQAWVAGSTTYEFSGLDSSGFVNGVPGALLAAGAGAAVLSANTVTLQSGALAQQMAGAAQILIGDGFLPAAGQALLPIVNASVSGDLVTIDTDPAAGPIPVVGNWELRRLHFRTLVDGSPGALPSPFSAQILFEGAQETSPGSMTPDLTSVVGPSADPAALNSSILVRFRVFFDRNPSGLPVSPALPGPGIEFLKLHYSF